MKKKVTFSDEVDVKYINNYQEPDNKNDTNYLKYFKMNFNRILLILMLIIIYLVINSYSNCI